MHFFRDIFDILLPKLFWPTVRKKNVLVIKKNFWNSKLKAKNLQILWEIIKTVKVQNNFW